MLIQEQRKITVHKSNVSKRKTHANFFHFTSQTRKFILTINSFIPAAAPLLTTDGTGTSVRIFYPLMNWISDRSKQISSSQSNQCPLTKSRVCRKAKVCFWFLKPSLHRRAKVKDYVVLGGFPSNLSERRKTHFRHIFMKSTEPEILP